jgi:hypothetical protein
MAVDGKANLGGIGVLLSVVFPPADGAQPHGAGLFQCSVSAARTTIKSLGRRVAGGKLHIEKDGVFGARVYRAENESAHGSHCERTSLRPPSILYNEVQEAKGALPNADTWFVVYPI